MLRTLRRVLALLLACGLILAIYGFLFGPTYAFSLGLTATFFVSTAIGLLHLAMSQRPLRWMTRIFSDQRGSTQRQPRRELLPAGARQDSRRVLQTYALLLFTAYSAASFVYETHGFIYGLLEPQNAAENSTIMFAPELEKLLQDTLPGHATQATRHQEIVDAIRSIQPGSSAPPQWPPERLAPDGLSFGSAIVIATVLIGTSIFAIGGWFLFRASIGIWLKVIVLLAMFVMFPTTMKLSLFSGDLVFSRLFEGLLASTPPVTLNPPDTTASKLDLNLKIDINAPQSLTATGGLDCGQGQGYQIGPFTEGTHDQLERLQSINEFLEALRLEKANRNGERITGLLLIGSADKRPLKPDIQRKYQTNMGLAQARAIWVREQLEKTEGLAPLIRATATFYRGPTHVSANASPIQLSTDRSVIVCASWQ